MLEEIVRSWEGNSLKSPRPPKISSSTTFLSSRRKLQPIEPGWDFTARQTRSSTGQMAPRWRATLHGPLVNRTTKLRNAPTCMVRDPRRESGTTWFVPDARQKLHWLLSFSARRTLNSCQLLFRTVTALLLSRFLGPFFTKCFWNKCYAWLRFSDWKFDNLCTCTQ